MEISQPSEIHAPRTGRNNRNLQTEIEKPLKPNQMTIEPKFKIGELVKHKYQKHQTTRDGAFAFSINEIQTVTCTAGTQIFYTGRWILQVVTGYGESKKIGDFMPHEQIQKFREDELSSLPEDILKQIEP
jgi:hypothetical protein